MIYNFSFNKFGKLTRSLQEHLEYGHGCNQGRVWQHDIRNWSCSGQVVQNCLNKQTKIYCLGLSIVLSSAHLGRRKVGLQLSEVLVEMMLLVDREFQWLV